MSALDSIKELVQSAIDQGASTVEQVQKKISEMPTEILDKVGPLEETVQNAKEIGQKTIGNVQEKIQELQQQASEVAEELLSKIKK